MKNTLHSRVVDAVGQRIVSGEMPPGTTFTLADLEETHGISRSVAREVVRVVESLGLVTSRRRVGSTVAPPASWNVLAPQVIRWQLAQPLQHPVLQSLIELRAGLEPSAARLAARRATDAEVAAMTQAAEEMAELGRRGRGAGRRFLAADTVFHTTLLRASHNPAYRALEPTVVACMEQRTRAGFTPAEPQTVNLQAHIDLAVAIGVGDEDAAAALAHAIVSIVADETVR